MSITLHNLHPNEGSNRPKKRLGRGRGSGTGKTSGKGVKGQKARPGHHGARFAFEGGQMPMPRRVPKRGFKNPFRTEYQVVNLDRLQVLFPEGGQVSVADLVAKGAVRDGFPVKVLGTGEISVKVEVEAHKFSASAKEKIEAAGGSVTSLDVWIRMRSCAVTRAARYDDIFAVIEPPRTIRLTVHPRSAR